MTTSGENHAGTSHVAARPYAPQARFQRVYEENYRLLFHYVYSWVGNREDAEDLTSSIFLKAAGGIDYERPPKMIRPWLFKIARTTLIDHWRARDPLILYSLEGLLASGEREPVEDEPGLSNTTPDDRLHQLLLSRLTACPSPEELFDEEDDGKGQPATGDDSATERVGCLLQGLPAHYRDVLICRFLLNLSIRDTARRLGLTEANVKVTRSRALKRAAELE
jgi:RNA polymerase sigma-70 factor, ECF subfamily